MHLCDKSLPCSQAVMEAKLCVADSASILIFWFSINKDNYLFIYQQMFHNS